MCTRGTRGAACALVLLSVFVAAPSLADSLEATRYDVHERAHLIDARLERGHATLVVTRTIENTGPKSDQAIFHIDLPEGAVATRLRTSGVGANGETLWFEGELMEAEAAAAKYKELTGIGGYYPKDPALLSWRSQKHLALQVFPVPARATKTVEYTLRIPLKYDGGVYKMTLPNIGTEASPAKVKLSAANPEDVVEVNGVSVARESSITASRELEVKLRPRTTGPLEGALASFGFADKRVLVHGRVAASPRLSTVPANAAVVVLVDASRSEEQDFSVEIAAVRAYLSHFEGAQVEVLTFDREVHSPFGGFLPVKEAVSKLHGFAPTLRNGSRVDEAIARADEHLAKSTAPAKRILLLSDLKVRDSLTPEGFAKRTLASGALLHMATVTAGPASVTRDDESGWAKLPRATGGLLWSAACNPTVDPPTRTVFEEWARPKRIDKLVVKGMPAELVAPAELVEGEGIEHFSIDTKQAVQLAIEGELWSRSIRWSTSPSADEGRRWAGLVFGSELLGELSEKEEMTLALHGRAVSPVTSYLAIEPGVRPSTEGLDPAEIGFGTASGTGMGFGSASGRHMLGTKGPDSRQSFLDRALATALTTCGAKDAKATATLESTRIEIVDVREVALAPTRNAKTEACVTEEMWKVDLTSSFDSEHSTWSVASR